MNQGKLEVVKQEMSTVNVDILGISKLKWTELGEFNSDDNTITDTLHPFFQVFDHFSMAVAATETTTNMQSLLEGMKMIRAEFDRAFSELGIERIDATGKDFDPNTQEAMSQEASDTVPAGKVIRQWCFGYKMGDRLLKPANVVVSSGPAEKENK